ncbi:MAG: phenylalanine--tRNA ligase beta subunit-related protein [Candidatus Krumholzibacteriia bacterium]
MSPSCRLPDGRTVAVAPEAADRLCAGVVLCGGCRPDAADGAALAAEALGRDLAVRWAGTPPSAIPGLAEARDLYKSFGMEPTRYRPSSEALLRRLLQGKGLYRLGNLVDACNLASLSFLLPIGMYDLAKVRGDVTLRTGTAGDAYAGIRKGPVNLEGRLGLFDAEGPFGSPTSDSARTATDGGTTTVLAVVMATGGYPAAGMAANLDVFTGLFATHCGAVGRFAAVLGGRP